MINFKWIGSGYKQDLNKMSQNLEVVLDGFKIVLNRFKALQIQEWLFTTPGI